MRVLFITFSFPPHPESQTIRNVYFVRGLCRRGFDVTVITGAEQEGDPTLLEMLPASVRVRRTSICFYDAIQAAIRRLPTAAARRWSRSGWAVLAGKLFVPDLRFDWKKRAIVIAREVVRTERFDLIVSSAGSYAAHEVAGELAREIGLPWLAEYGDPWALNPLPPLSLPKIRNRNLRVERAVLRACSGMTVTTEQTAQIYHDWLGDECPAIEVIPCGFTRIAGSSHLRTNPSEWVIAYVGSASRSNRDLRGMMQRIDELLGQHPDWTITLQIVGSHSPAFFEEAKRLSRLRVKFSGWVSYEESIRRMEAADLLLLYGNSMPIQVPGKLFNYVATLRPILYIGQIPAATDPSLEFLAGLPGVRAFDTVRPVMTSDLAAMFANFAAWAGEAVRRREHMAWFAAHDWGELGNRFAVAAHRTMSAVVAVRS